MKLAEKSERATFRKIRENLSTLGRVKVNLLLSARPARAQPFCLR